MYMTIRNIIFILKMFEKHYKLLTRFYNNLNQKKDFSFLQIF